MPAGLTANTLIISGMLACSALGCASRTAFPAAMAVGEDQSGAVSTQVSELTVRKVVGETAVADCKRAFELGWNSCATVADRCSQLVLMANGQAMLWFNPENCTANLQVGQWLLASPKTDKQSLVPIRGPDDAAPHITPRP
jgi:hypothetical protein